MNANMGKEELIRSIKRRIEEVTKIGKEDFIAILTKAGKWQ
jgi:hypothetical protein